MANVVTECNRQIVWRAWQVTSDRLKIALQKQFLQANV